MKTPLEQTSARLEDAYNELKGGTEHVSPPTANDVLDVVSTARTNGYRRPSDNRTIDSVTAHFKNNTVTTVPDVVSAIADRHDLVEATREYEYESDTLSSVVFVRTEDLPENANND